ncbi:phosphoribosyl-ATP pyrophosphohydrolase [Sporosarcina sp. PTS2304]|uniref:nucleoside triphosphate pyrophosphohydrolase n=1 Tax=Sporosarcina sp. PTS2304 TaxID=2283194 RepID=UPI000E0D20EE|nr:nucleoside triphosphate pyrophosphohydrolase [Sporosarcina sp. PTS2304]AXI00981.1 phosphoribosyl-ATP pyrophosphohydrolase [Sporosarcina sp. PTS2304]
MPIYNKLVRNLIPAIIEKDGKTCVTKTLDASDYSIEVTKKMREELAEYERAETTQDSLEELADLLELIHAAATIHGASIEELETIRASKATIRGGFDKRIFLVEVHDD